MRIFYLITAVTLVLAGCGGGGGGTPSQASLSTVAAIKYTATTLPTSYVSDPWTIPTILLTPEVTGLPANATKTFSASGLPQGLQIDAATGKITSVDALTRDDLDSPISITVSMGANGYSGSISTAYDLKFSSYSVAVLNPQSRFYAGAWLGFDANGNSTAKVNTTLIENYGSGLFLATYRPDGTISTDALPSTATRRYELVAANTTAVGATIDSSTGEVTWTPSAAGTYQIQVRVNVTNSGVTKSATWGISKTVVSL